MEPRRLNFVRLSISAKILIAFLVVLGTSAAVTLYGAFSMRRLGDELRLVSRGYLELRLQITDLQTQEANLIRLLNDQLPRPDAPTRMPGFVKIAIDDARRSRLKQLMPAALLELRSLENLRPSGIGDAEHALLTQLRTRLEGVGQQVRANEELYDLVYGHIGDSPPLTMPTDVDRLRAGKTLRDREQVIRRDLSHLTAELRLRAQQAGLRLEESENRAVFATMLLAVISILVGVAVMFIATRTVRPLRRLAERAKEIARGDYEQRVDASARDEIGALGREFNAMAGALQEREQQLIRSERLATVGKIAAQITHEVRNPLSSIGLNAELLEEVVAGLEGTPAQLDEAKALVRAIVKEVDRLAEITEEYLRFARLPRPRLEPEDLTEIITALAAFLSPELRRAGVELVVDLPPLPPIAADENQLRQALLNLLRNATEAMAGAGGGRLSVAATVEPRALEISVTDTGPGIAAEHLDKIFDPFFSTKERGTGLGLALTQQIIAEHGGRITVETELGRGTTFRVRLPVTPVVVRQPASDDPDATVAPADPQLLAPPTLGRARAEGVREP